VDALTRIFKLCDANKDGILDASELNEFQVCTATNYILSRILLMPFSGNASTPLFKHKSSRASNLLSGITIPMVYEMAA
jgi:hypothetical protein